MIVALKHKVRAGPQQREFHKEILQIMRIGGEEFILISFPLPTHLLLISAHLINDSIRLSLIV
ncbi:hypothetical protein BUZ33_04215 [Staphylococcus haemolyticus]|nr:hypothetical protein BUZ44_04105 [Staphylococcus haemolyticus]PTK56752.1 hypothetical protein BUZ33_04215 [Staphylococcus haemolyticus]PTK69519.1 hypothetical protein BUZ32_01160 [Staphylococcus haemolyticus]PTK73295.1 hypothetical protein BUZ29_05405 [Staphylococcus haemolyticus]PTL03588.1 hypothetical protein BUZ18_03510 [Staphylococcus haemolyticus]